MKQSILAGLAGLPAALALTAGCATSVPPATQAAQVEQLQCDAPSTEAENLRIIQTAYVLEAEPLHSHVMTADGAEERVDGAKLVVRPPNGVSAELMTRVLQCHGARALLGKVDAAAVPGDPFWLPDTWVSVEVRPENGNYAVTLEANDVPTNLRLAARAEAYAQTHRGEAPQLQ